MCLEATWFVAAFHSTPIHDPGLEESNVQLGSACERVPVPVRYLASSARATRPLPPAALASVPYMGLY